MTEGFSRLMLGAAVRAMPPAHRSWARAMEAEFEEAAARGQPLRFAAGCLLAAWRALPSHGEGRFALSTHAIALGLILPAGIFHLGCALAGARLVAMGDDPFHAKLASGGAGGRAIADAYLATAPTATSLVLLLGAVHLVIAWNILEGRWRRVAIAWMLGSVAATALVAIIAAFVPGARAGAIQVAPLALELFALPLLFRWRTSLDQTRTERHP